MANNRMLLVYEPTGDAVYLGKRMGYGWYDVPADIKESIEALFKKAEKYNEDQDAFILILETDPRCEGYKSKDGKILKVILTK